MEHEYAVAQVVAAVAAPVAAGSVARTGIGVSPFKARLPLESGTTITGLRGPCPVASLLSRAGEGTQIVETASGIDADSSKRNPFGLASLRQRGR
jgi:hypothetical protein